MEQWKFLELAKKVLEEEKMPLSPGEIWEIASSKGYTQNVETNEGQNPWMALSSLILHDILNKKKQSLFHKVSSNPARFYLKSVSQDFKKIKINDKKTQSIPKINKKEYKEKDLHPLLAYYAKKQFDAYLKTIEHSKSKRGKGKKFLEWNHPDMVGFYSPFDVWDKKVVELNLIIRTFSIKIFSFEIKRELSSSNLRESFFQTVSNSSWANEGYLVAAKLSGNDEDFLSELKRLSTSFGIGVIELDISDPDNSRVLYPAKFREYLDWETINKLAINPDFVEFLESIVKIMRVGGRIEYGFDEVKEKKELLREIMEWNN